MPHVEADRIDKDVGLQFQAAVLNDAIEYLVCGLGEARRIVGDAWIAVVSHARVCPTWLCASKGLVHQLSCGKGEPEVAKQVGRKSGRKLKITNSKIESTKKLLVSGVPPKDVAKNLGMSIPTLYRWVPASDDVLVSVFRFFGAPPPPVHQPAPRRPLRVRFTRQSRVGNWVGGHLSGKAPDRRIRPTAGRHGHCQSGKLAHIGRDQPGFMHSRRNCPTMACACSDKGTTCGKRSFMRSAGMTHTAPSSLNSDQRIARSSPTRTNVCASSCNPSRVTGSS